MLKKAKEASEKDEKKKRKHPAAEAPAQPSEATEDSEQPAADDDSDAGEGEPGAGPGQGADDEGASSGEDDSQGDSAGQQAEPAQGDSNPQPGDQGQTPPVKNPQAPGAGDDTSGGADTPAPGEGEGDTGGGETPGDSTAAGPGSESSLPQIPMSPQLKAEFQLAVQMLMKQLYAAPNDAAAKGIIGGLQPQGQAKIRSAVHLSLVVGTSIIKKLGAKDFPPQIVLPFLKEVVAHVMDLGQQVKQIQYSDQESVAILGAVYEGALRIFGVTRGQGKILEQHLGRKTLMKHAQLHQKAFAFAKPGIDAAQGQQGVGTPQEAGPQSGAMPGTQSTPQQGAPPTPPPPAGGPLAQAAAASPMAQGEGNG